MVPATAEVIDRFRAALVARDIVAPAQIIADGSIHRCDAEGRNGKGDAAYLLHLDGIPAGGLENWRDGKGWESWRFDIGRALTAAELDALRKRAQIARSQRDEAEARRHAAASALAARIWRQRGQRTMAIRIWRVNASARMDWQAMSAILNGRAGISANMALRLSEALGTSAEVWTGMQSAYDLWQARQKKRPKVKALAKAA